ncbi:hypothetical protein BDW59DRAFT_143804 [Aspergillus cavernicola]|uniref:C2H2-type domain-containing protein n=1 Tax=Aspergillus cavernicola TaxID=176166 RepID=A0ABR4IJ16_9EURO
MATIASILNDCIAKFIALLGSGQLDRFEAEIPTQLWQDELGRLRVWAGNIGAHQIGQSSLDYRLRDASHIKSETLSLLETLKATLQDLGEVAEETGTDRGKDEPDLGVEGYDLCESDLTEVQQMYQSLVEVISYLYRMSMLIRQPSRHDQLLEAHSKDASFFMPWAKQHISHKFPGARSDLISRLATAMTKQKGILKYRERHRDKLSQGLQGRAESESVNFSETIATDFSATRDHLQFLESMSDSGISKTSYAMTLLGGNCGTSIPEPPRESNDRQPFECPYCYIIITIKDRNDWARHIFHDLMPYVCIYEQCSTPSRLYESRRAWYLHLLDKHGADLQTCPLCNLDIKHPETLDRHVGRHFEELALFVLPRTDSNEQEELEAPPPTTSLTDDGSMTESEADMLPDSVLHPPTAGPETANDKTRTTSDTKLHDPSLSPGLGPSQELKPVARSSTFRSRLEEFCLNAHIEKPTYNTFSDRRGGRTAWTCYVTVLGRTFSARYWFEGAFIEYAMEDAAEVALQGLSGHNPPQPGSPSDELSSAPDQRA